MYTSGTTGDPKGVELTQFSVMSTVKSMVTFLAEYSRGFDLHDEVYLSYLPLAHIFDRASEEMILYNGGSIGYWRGDIKGLVDDISALKPTLFCGVPRVFDRIYSGALEKITSSFVKKFYTIGVIKKLHALDAGYPFDKASPFFDAIMFKKIKAKLGGRVRLIVSGGAPLSRHVEDFLRVTMCCVGTVGPPQPCISVRLEAVPDMECDPMANPPRGELCIKGPSVFSGYIRMSKDSEVLESDGWFHTGDIAEITPEGAVKIVDRKKSIFKLAQGEYVAVEKIEGCCKKNPFVEQIWVYGNSLESCLVAIVVPKENHVHEWAKHHGHKSASFEDMCKSDDLQQAILKSLAATAKEEKLKGFEIPKAVFIESELFSVENDLLTPTFKSKRPQLQKKYQGIIDDMYAKLKAK
eukprot:jgi/Picre1/31430/NNA_006782.t1